jgi:hypothetical protein
MFGTQECIKGMVTFIEVAHARRFIETPTKGITGIQTGVMTTREREKKHKHGRGR